MIQILFAAAIALFVLSLPVHATGFGASLRRWAGFCFAAALLPALIGGMLFPGARLTFADHPLLMTFVLAVASTIAYGVYIVRSWLLTDPKKKQKRIQEKTPLDRPRRQEDLFDLFLDNQPPQGPEP